MKKDKTLLRFRIYDGDREYTDYAVITNKQRLFYTDGQIISKFFCDEDIDDEQFLSDGRAVRIESQIPISNGDMIKLEKLKNGELEITDKKGKKQIIKGKLIEKDGQTFFKIKAKKVYLDNKNPFAPLQLTDKKTCMHCDKDFVVGDYQILIEGNKDYIVCPNTPECDGTIIDWMNN